MDELLRALDDPKFDLNGGEREDLLADYLPWCETVTGSKPAKSPLCRDPFDLLFLELALAGRADALLNGDKDLFAMAHAFPVPILTPRAFRNATALFRTTGQPVERTDAVSALTDFQKDSSDGLPH